MIKEVRKWIRVNPSLADSDVDLIWSIWTSQVDNIDELPAIELMRLWKHGKISSPSNITRSRRKCQEMYPETRGVTYNGRHKEADRVIEDIRSIGN
tara:strand:+ start:788 stop:1075 length:288 start_codon:yes stop_codon:yes gene_type:complete